MSITESCLPLAQRHTMNLRVAIVLFLGALLPSAALADEAELQAMAVKALRWAFYAPNGYRWEFSGILATKDGQLGYSQFPRTLKMVDAAEMDVEKQRTAGDTVVGLYHTHPCKPDAYFSQYFSAQDLISAFFWHVPAFILDECTGNVHEFDPAQDRAADSGIVVRMLMRDGKKRWIRLPAGRVVGNIGDQGPDLSLLERLMASAED
jgi:proteasome lid subunit RPN8/RPN11